MRVNLSVFRNKVTKLAFRSATISTNGPQDSNPVLSDPVSSALTIRPPHPKQLIKGRYFFIYLSLGSRSKVLLNFHHLFIVLRRSDIRPLLRQRVLGLEFRRILKKQATLNFTARTFFARSTM